MSETQESTGEALGETTNKAKKPLWLRLLPIAVIVIALLAVRWTGAYEYLSFEKLQEFQDALRNWTAANPLLAPLTVAAIYAVGTAISVPGMVWVTLAAGFLFGTVIGTLTVVVGATVGAVAIFLAVRYALADLLRAKAGKWLDKVDKEMQTGQVSYLITMRMIPVIPFWVANLAPAFLDVKARTFAWTTFVGIIPLVAVFCSVGAGIGTLLSSGEEPDLGQILLNPRVIGPLIALIGVSLLPIILRKRKQAQKAAAQNV